ncbi:MAG: flippase [bacterium]
MGATRVIAKNTFLLTLGLLAGRALAMVVWDKMTPILGPEGFGIWGLATDLSVILLTIANFGLGALITREVIRAKTMTLPIFWAALRIRWFIGAVGYLLLLAYTQFSGITPVAQAAVLITGISVFIEATSMACDGVLQAHEKVEYQAVGQLVSAVVYFGLAIWFLDAGHGLMGVIWANLLSRVSRLLVMAPLMFLKTGPWRWRAPETEESPQPTLRWMMRLGWPLFLSTTFGILYFKIDVVMIMEFKGEIATGIYVLGHRMLDVLLIGPNLFATALFPALARSGADAKDDVVRLGERALRYMLFVIFPLTLLCTFVAPVIIGIFDSNGEFPHSIPIMRIVVWGLPLQAASCIFNRLLITAGREKDFVKIALLSLLVNVGLNLILIPRFSYYGAAVATIVGLGTSCVLHFSCVRRTDLWPPLRLAVGGSLVALAGSWLVTTTLAHVAIPELETGWFGLPLQGWRPFLTVTTLFVMLYIGAIFGLRVLRLADLRLLRQLIKGDQ